jgi:hypothetical protein
MRMSAESAVMQERDVLGRVVLGPAGRPITLDDLPPPGTKRWVVRRKAEVVAAVRAGLISLEEACRRYTLSAEEFESWQRLMNEYGVRGLRTTRIQKYRSPKGDGSEPGDAVA